METRELADRDTSFARLVSLAAHDLRTPLATVHGFARTLERVELGDPATRYVEMIALASGQLAELLDELGLAARIESGRYEPALRDADTLALAGIAAERLGADRVVVSGAGGAVRIDPEAIERAVAAFAQAALRHGGLERVELRAAGDLLELGPVTASSAPVLLGRELRDLGAAVGVRAVEAIGGSVSLEGDTLTVRLPQ